MRTHVGAVTHAEKQRACRPVLIFMYFAGWMHDKATRCHGDALRGGPHRPAAGKTEIDFGRMRVAMIGADLAGLPAGNGNVAIGDFPEDLFDVVLRVPLLF